MPHVLTMRRPTSMYHYLTIDNKSEWVRLLIVNFRTPAVGISAILGHEREPTASELIQHTLNKTAFLSPVH